MTALPKDLEFEAGATFEWGFNYVRSKIVAGKPVPDPDNPYDLTGCDLRMQVRAKITDETSLLSLSTPDNGLSVGPDGRIDILVTDEQTSALYKTQPGKALTAVYDLELIWPLLPGASRRKVTRLLKGSISVSPGVTRDNDLPPDGTDDE